MNDAKSSTDAQWPDNGMASGAGGDDGGRVRHDPEKGGETRVYECTQQVGNE